VEGNGTHRKRAQGKRGKVGGESASEAPRGTRRRGSALQRRRGEWGQRTRRRRALDARTRTAKTLPTTRPLLCARAAAPAVPHPEFGGCRPGCRPHTRRTPRRVGSAQTTRARHVEWGARRPHAHATSSGERADHTRTPRRVGSAKTIRARHVEWGARRPHPTTKGVVGPGTTEPVNGEGPMNHDMRRRRLKKRPRSPNE